MEPRLPRRPRGEKRNKKQVTGSGRRKFIALKAWRLSVSTGPKKGRARSKKRWVSHGASRQSPMNCAQRRALPGCGASRAGGGRAGELLAPIYGWFTEG